MYNYCMARRSFSKRIVRKIKRMLKPDEAKNIIEREFTDSHGNKSRLILDFNPHKPSEPTIQGGYNYGENK